ncbi:MAG: hypothetical protein SFV23_02400 [Planctomycetaceae bacterium]|nr:hypothetical protein [Planctomycetaceae bacterium]
MAGEPEGTIIEASIEHSRLDIAQLANQLVVQSDGEMFYLHFCQSQPPFLDSERIKSATGFTVKAHPVASIAVPRDKMPSFLSVMQTQYERLMAAIAKRT